VKRRNLFTLAALFALWAAPLFALDQVVEKRYPLAPGAGLELTNINGSVRIDAWERNVVEIRAVKSTRRDPNDLDRVQIEFRNAADGLAIHTRYPEDAGVDVSVDYHLRVPSHVRLTRVETVNGNLRVQGIEGTGRLRSVNGNVELYDGAGRFSARTTNGNVRIELRRLDAGAPVALETVNGSVVIALPPDAGAELDVTSSNGDFLSELPLVAERADTGRGFRARLGRGGSLLEVRTVNGGIRVITARPSV